VDRFRTFPWAFAHGYLLSPHPRLKNAQRKNSPTRAHALSNADQVFIVR
jgi:hypothetical protein